MAASNHRIRETSTYHRLISRIAHRVYFMKDEERNDFVEMMRRVAEFSGITLVAWCVLTNHFHILAYLPEAVEIGEDEEAVVMGEVRKSRSVITSYSNARPS